MNTTDMPVRRNRDAVLPPFIRHFKEGNLTVEQVADLAYQAGLDFGWNAGVEHGVTNPDD